MNTPNAFRVLVVEDDPYGQDVIQRILRSRKIGYDVAVDGNQALTFLESHIYSAAVIDLALPGVDGWGVVRAIRDNPRTAAMPCIACTAYHSPEVALQARQEGFTSYIPKPFDPVRFAGEIERILNEQPGA